MIFWRELYSYFQPKKNEMLFSLFLLLVLTLHQANSQTCTNVASYVSDGLYYFYEEANNGDQCKFI